MENQFAISPNKINELYNLTKKQYHPEIIALIHSGIILSPLFISLKILPQENDLNILNPNFRINTIHVGISMRILGLSKYGLLFFQMLEKYNVKNWDDINIILIHMQDMYKKDKRKSPSLWMSSLVDLKESDNSIFKNKPLLKNLMSEEVDFCDEIIHKIFATQYSLKEKEDKISKFIEEIDKFLNENKD